MEKQKIFSLDVTEKELKNPNIKKTIADLVTLKAQLQSHLPYFEVSEAEVEVLNMVPLFTSIKEYGEGKFPGEVGKLKSSRVVLKKKIK